MELGLLRSPQQLLTAYTAYHRGALRRPDEHGTTPEITS